MTRTATLVLAALVLAGPAAARAATPPETPLALGPGPDWCAPQPQADGEAPKAPACHRVAEEV